MSGFDRNSEPLTDMASKPRARQAQRLERFFDVDHLPEATALESVNQSHQAALTQPLMSCVHIIFMGLFRP